MRIIVLGKCDFDVVLQRVSKEDGPDVAGGEMMIDHRRDGQSIRATSGTWVRRQVCRFTCEDSRSGISNLSIMFPYAGQRIINGRGDAILPEYSKRWELGCAFELHATLNHVGPPASLIQIPTRMKQILLCLSYLYSRW